MKQLFILKGDILMKKLGTALAATALILGLLSIDQISAATLAQYDPTGPRCSCTPVSPINVAAGVTASDLSEVGMIGDWVNTNTLPVGQFTVSPSIQLDQYVTFQITPTTAICYDSVLYSKRSYIGHGPLNASIRSSLDGFASDIATVGNLNPAGPDDINFDLSPLPATAAPVEFRIYFWNVSIGDDFADLDSSGRGRTGLVVTDQRDRDGDEVVDCSDACLNTPAGEVVDAHGCSGAQLVDLSCPCSGGWRNHGEYVSCVAREAEGQVQAGLLTAVQKDAIVSARAETSCGRN
jgi:hypothetical protein